MIGWMIVFALLAILGVVMTLANPAVAVASTMVGIVFAALFLLGLLTRLMRRRAW